MFTTMGDTSSEVDFMVHDTAVFLNIHQLELVFFLLEQQVDPAFIPDEIRQRRSGVDLTVGDVEAISHGRFHVSGRDFQVRMSTSDNLIPIEIVDDLFQLLATNPTLESLRRQIEVDHGVTICVKDLCDMRDGEFYVEGPQNLDSLIIEELLVPTRECSEAVWIFEKGCCSAEFLSDYVWFRFGSHLPSHELVRLTHSREEDFDEDIDEDAALDAIIKSAPSMPVNPPCLKRRALPPPPIMTFGPSPMADNVFAVQPRGGTYSANPFVLSHNADGTYTTFADFSADLQTDSSSTTSSSFSGISSIFVRTLDPFATGEFLSDLEQPRLDGIQALRPDPVGSFVESNMVLSWLQNLDIPDNDQHGPLWLPDLQQPDIIASLGSSPKDIDTDSTTDSNTDEDLVLEELQTNLLDTREEEQGFANLPSLPPASFEEMLEQELLEQALTNLPSLPPSPPEGLLDSVNDEAFFDQGLVRSFDDPNFIDLERGDLLHHPDNTFNAGIQSFPGQGLEASPEDMDTFRSSLSRSTWWDTFDKPGNPSLKRANPFLQPSPMRKKTRSFVGCSNHIQ